MNIFISQPMNGLTDQEILNVRNRVIGKAKDKFSDVEFLETFFEGNDVDYGSRNPGMMFLALSINKMAYADIVIMAYGWEKARGCRIEQMTAQEYGVHTLYETYEMDAGGFEEVIPACEEDVWKGR